MPANTSPPSPASTVLRYPRTGLYEEHTDYVRFSFYEYIPPFAGDSGAKTFDYAKTVENAKPAKGLASILLYMPEDIQSAFTSDWGDKSFTNTQRDLLGIAGASLGKGGSPGATISALVSSAGNVAGRLPSAVAQQIANGINNLPGGLGGNTSLNDVLSGTKGVVLNPNVELLFQGFGLREFDLNYKFTPRNLEEAKDIKKIINTFKVASLPRFGSEKGLGGLIGDANTDARGGASVNAEDRNSNYITVPNLCQVAYKKGADDHPYLPKWKLAAITGVDVNYTPDGSYATYEDGSPVATGLSLRFAETKLVYGDEISIDSAEAQY